MEESILPIPNCIRDNETVGAGLSSWVHRLDAVAKCYTSGNEKDREREIAVYERLGTVGACWPETILKYYGELNDLVILQFAAHGTVRGYLRSRPKIPLSVKLRWAEQATEAISILHSKGVLHCDISCNNIFLDKDLNAMVGDFAGSSIDDEPCLGWYEEGHYHPESEDPSEQSEIFALGSTFYEMLVEQTPALETHAFSKRQSHILESLPALGDVIFKCWNGHYRTVDDLLKDIRREAQCPPHRVFHVSKALALAFSVVVPIVYWMRSSRLQKA